MIIQNFSLLTPMKKITRPLFRILTSFCIISWIYFSQHYFTEKIEKNQSITWEKQDQKSNIFSLSWSIPQFTITPQNAYDIVIKTGENLLYRNEIYGFQILLDKKRVFWYFGTTLGHDILLQYFPEMRKQCEPSNDGYGWRNCGEDPIKLIMLTGFSTFEIE